MPSPTDKPISDTTPAELILSETAAPDSATPKWDRVEQERLTRRAALRKMGYTSGIALFSMFAVDDLARMAIKKMEQHKETKQIAETVAREFKNSGIALANSGSNYNGCPTIFCDCTYTCGQPGTVGADGRTFDQCIGHCVDVNNPPSGCSCP